MSCVPDKRSMLCHVQPELGMLCILVDMIGYDKISSSMSI